MAKVGVASTTIEKLGRPRLRCLGWPITIDATMRSCDHLRETDWQGMLNLKTLVTGFFALAWLTLIVPMAAVAGSDTEPYLDGDVKEALASGETILLHYKSTW